MTNKTDTCDIITCVRLVCFQHSHHHIVLYSLQGIQGTAVQLRWDSKVSLIVTTYTRILLGLRINFDSVCRDFHTRKPQVISTHISLSYLN